jgi:DNA-binding NarL/FixJ family response regulator
MATEPDHLARGASALADAEWDEAKAAFEAALECGEGAEALSGLGEAVWWLGDIERGVGLRERAYIAYRDRRDWAPAARLALWLATEHAGALGNQAVGDGWLSRAERLIDGMGECPERGWLLLRRSRRAPDATLAERLSLEALDVARTVADRDLEIAAISQQGRALLAGGHVEEGFRRLDEAMAAATGGEARSKETIADTCCDMIVACERTVQIERATQWCRVTDEYARRYKFRPLFAFCRVTYAGILLTLGRWDEAERELHEALRSYEASLASKSFLAIAKLAELRLLQGREAEAEELLSGQMLQPGFGRVVAMLHLVRGDPAAAVRVLRKRLAAVEPDVLMSAPLLELLVDGLLASGNVAEAATAAHRLEAVAATTRCAAFAASAAHAAALVGCAKKSPAAVDDFERAIQAYSSIGMPLPAARARIGLARCLADTDAPAAKDECRAAVAVLERLGARRDLDAAADLRRRLGVGAHVGTRTTGKLTRREEEVLGLLGLGLSNAQIGQRLFISPKTVEHHVGHVLDKLDVKTRAAAAAHAARTGSRKPATK